MPLCICQIPEDVAENDPREMICCDQCNNWFHFDCLGLLPEDVPEEDSFFCQDCRDQLGLGPLRARRQRKKSEKAIAAEEADRILSTKFGLSLLQPSGTSPSTTSSTDAGAKTLFKNLLDDEDDEEPPLKTTSVAVNVPVTRPSLSRQSSAESKASSVTSVQSGKPVAPKPLANTPKSSTAVTPKAATSARSAPLSSVDAQRDRMRKALSAALDDNKELSRALERALFNHNLRRIDGKYKQQMFDILANLKDPSNLDFKAQVVSGELTPIQVAEMPASEMVSREVRENRLRLQREREYDMMRSDVAAVKAVDAVVVIASDASSEANDAAASSSSSSSASDKPESSSDSAQLDESGSLETSTTSSANSTESSDITSPTSLYSESKQMSWFMAGAPLPSSDSAVALLDSSDDEDDAVMHEEDHAGTSPTSLNPEVNLTSEPGESENLADVIDRARHEQFRCERLSQIVRVAQSSTHPALQHAMAPLSKCVQIARRLTQRSIWSGTLDLTGTLPHAPDHERRLFLRAQQLWGPCLDSLPIDLQLSDATRIRTSSAETYLHEAINEKRSSKIACVFSFDVNVEAAGFALYQDLMHRQQPAILEDCQNKAQQQQNSLVQQLSGQFLCWNVSSDSYLRERSCGFDRSTTVHHADISIPSLSHPSTNIRDKCCFRQKDVWYRPSTECLGCAHGHRRDRHCSFAAVRTRDLVLELKHRSSDYRGQIDDFYCIFICLYSPNTCWRFI